MPTKSSNLYAKIEPEIKEKAESFLTTVRISISTLDEELSKGYQDMKSGRTINAKEVFASINKKYQSIYMK